MKIALAQMKILPGQINHNLRTMKNWVQQAIDQGCDLVAFPEMCVGGYLLGDRWTEKEWCDDLIQCNAELAEYSKNIILVYGNVYIDSHRKNKDGRTRKYNAAYMFQNGCPVDGLSQVYPGVALKTLLPNYRIFDDERYFFSLKDLALERGVSLPTLLATFKPVLQNKTYHLGLEICEDLWYTDYTYNQEALNVSKDLSEKQCDFLINISSSPWTPGKNLARQNRVLSWVKESKNPIPLYYVNCVGVQNNGKNIVVFDGDSTVYSAKGQALQRASEPFAETLLVHNTSEEIQNLYASNANPAYTNEHMHYLALMEGIKSLDDTLSSNSFPYIVGLSGGVDSALVATLLVQAVGKDRVCAYNLPSTYNSEASRGAAAQIAKALGIAYQVLPIQELIGFHENFLKPFQPSSFNLENIQAKIRGTSVLSNIAGIKNGVMTSNGNKVEIALGYATLYGDVNGAVAPLGDLLKTEVFALARHLNDKVFFKEVIPRCVLPNAQYEFELPPTAELRDRQIDPMKWGYHDALLQNIMNYNRLTPLHTLSMYAQGVLPDFLGIDQVLWRHYDLHKEKIFIDDLEWFFQSFNRAIFKRIQAPPIIMLSKSAFGYDFRESQLPIYLSRDYFKMRTEVLSRTSPYV